MDHSSKFQAPSIKGFCQRKGICRATYYNLPKSQRPRELRVGRRVIITPEAEAEWDERMSKEAENNE